MLLFFSQNRDWCVGILISFYVGGAFIEDARDAPYDEVYAEPNSWLFVGTFFKVVFNERQFFPYLSGLFFVRLNIYHFYTSFSSHLYTRVCPSVRRTVGPSVRRSNANSFIFQSSYIQIWHYWMCLMCPMTLHWPVGPCSVMYGSLPSTSTNDEEIERFWRFRGKSKAEIG